MYAFVRNASCGQNPGALARSCRSHPRRRPRPRLDKALLHESTFQTDRCARRTIYPYFEASGGKKPLIEDDDEDENDMGKAALHGYRLRLHRPALAFTLVDG
jgi:hypothetical protein